jgi:Flp pilus assembly protein TadG
MCSDLTQAASPAGPNPAGPRPNTVGAANRLMRRRRTEHGVSAVEFAFIAPVMLLMLFGAAEASLAISVDRKVTIAASTVADLVAQSETLDCDTLQDIVQVTRSVFAPYNGAAASISVAQVTIESGAPKVQWSKMVTATTCANAPSMPVGSNITIAGNSALVSNMIETGGGIIVGEVLYTHAPDLTSFFTDSLAMSERFYLRPRASAQVCWDNNSATAGCQP